MDVFVALSTTSQALFISSIFERKQVRGKICLRHGHNPEEKKNTSQSINDKHVSDHPSKQPQI